MDIDPDARWVSPWSSRRVGIVTCLMQPDPTLEAGGMRPEAIGRRLSAPTVARAGAPSARRRGRRRAHLCLRVKTQAKDPTLDCAGPALGGLATRVIRSDHRMFLRERTNGTAERWRLSA